jgi:hypothetical protein
VQVDGDGGVAMVVVVDKRAKQIQSVSKILYRTDSDLQESTGEKTGRRCSKRTCEREKRARGVRGEGDNGLSHAWLRHGGAAAGDRRTCLGGEAVAAATAAVRGLERDEVLRRRTGPGPDREQEDEERKLSWERSAMSL